MSWQWQTDTAPFFALGDDRRSPARFGFEQVSDNEFEIADGYGFRYVPDGGEPPVVVTSSSLVSTDFASIPRFMSWFVSRYGRHTPAALVHDQLIERGMPFDRAMAADGAFLSMMAACEVPPVRRTIMWSAVVLRTRWYGGSLRRVGLLAWFTVAALGIALLANSVLVQRWWGAAVAMVLQLPASALWGKQWRAALMAGYSLPVVLVPAFTSFVGYLAYYVIEWAFGRARKIVPRFRSAPAPDPVGFDEL
jgi:hypothetical protein